MVGSRSCWLDLGKSSPTIFSLASWFWAPTRAYCSLFNIGTITLRPDKYNKITNNVTVKF